jgi:outer membrane lipoprotein SlyB
MAIKTLIFSTPLLLISLQSFAGSTLDAAIGGGIGGATGAAIGNEIGGRDGAIIGGALGGATGAAIATKDDKQGNNTKKQTVSIQYKEPSNSNNKGSFCPPGQKKKGRC